MSAGAPPLPAPSRRHRWLRFDLRNFLVLIAAAGAWLGWQVHQVHRQQGAVEWVREQGGFVVYDFEWDART